jgi:hypothetical protein
LCEDVPAAVKSGKDVVVVAATMPVVSGILVGSAAAVVAAVGVVL